MSEIVPSTDSSEAISVPIIESESLESLDDYVTSKPTEIQRESTRSQISLWLLISFSGSILASYVMVCIAAFLPGVDKTIIRGLSSIGTDNRVKEQKNAWNSFQKLVSAENQFFIPQFAKAEYSQYSSY